MLIQINPTLYVNPDHIIAIHVTENRGEYYLSIAYAEMREGSTATIKTKFSATDEFEEFMQKITMA